MAQLNSDKLLVAHTRILKAENLAVSVAASGSTTLLDLFLDGIEKVSVALDVSVAALDAFTITGYVEPGSTGFTVASTAANYTAPAGRVLRSSGDLTTLSAASGQIDIDVTGLHRVTVTASANTSAATVSIWAHGTRGGQGSRTSGVGTALAPSTEVITAQRPAVTQVVSAALEASHILKASAGQLVQLTAFNSKATAQYILVLNSATLTADGAVTLLLPPIPIGAASLLVLDFPAPVVASAGITVCNSSTGSFTKTIGAADCAFYAQVN